MAKLGPKFPRGRGTALALFAGCLLAPTAESAAAAGDPQVVYLNFSDGTETVTRAAVDDAVTNRAVIGGASPYPAFQWPSITTGLVTRAAFIQEIARQVHARFAPYNVLITTRRPEKGPYTQVMIGGHPRDLGLLDDVGGLALLDCPNVEPANLVFAFPEKLRGSDHALVVTIAQEAAHAFGLEHTQNRVDLMNPVLDPRQERFVDAESAILGEPACGRGSQNSHRLLLQIVGPWLGDEKPFVDDNPLDRTPPAIVELFPPPGAALAQPFSVIVGATDETALDRVVLTVGGVAHTRTHAPYAWSLSGFPAGPLELGVSVFDTSGNIATSSNIVTLSAAAPVGGCQMAGRGTGSPSSPLWPLALLFALLITGRAVACARPPGPL